MTETYIKLIKEELKTRDLLQIQPDRLDSIIKNIRKSFLYLHALDELGKETFLQSIKRIIEDIKLLAKIRLLKVVLQEVQVSSNSIDTNTIESLNALFKVEETLLSPIVLRFDDKVVYLFKRNCFINGVLYRRNEITLLPINNLVLAEVSNCGEVLKDPFIQIQLRSTT